MMHLYALNHKAVNLRVVDEEGPPVSALVLHEGLQVRPEGVGGRGLDPRRRLLTSFQQQRE